MIVVDSNVIAYCWINGDRTPLVHGLRRRDPQWTQLSCPAQAGLRTLCTNASVTARARSLLPACEPEVTNRPCTPMAGTPANGPEHMDLYRKIQAAGKIVHVALPSENVEPLARQLDPGRLCLHTACRSVREADELLAAAERWTASRGAAGR